MYNKLLWHDVPEQFPLTNRLNDSEQQVNKYPTNPYGKINVGPNTMSLI